jgi:biotin synthase
MNTSEKETFYAAANDIRKHFCGNNMDLCSIVNAKSGKCSENCKWCSQSAYHKTDIETYQIIDKKTAVEEAISNRKQGVKRYSLVTSGHAAKDKELDSYLEIYKEIREKSDIQLCASMGLLNKAQLQRLKDAGITHYHCNLETAPSYFENVCTTHTMDEKIQTIKWSQEVGISTCSGGIIGMGESMEQRVELAFKLREIGSYSIPVNFLNPVEGTALQGTKPLTDDEVLSSIAIFRFINPKANIRLAGGRILYRHLQQRALNAGISASIVGDLLTTTGSNIQEDIRDFKKEGFVC